MSTSFGVRLIAVAIAVCGMTHSVRTASAQASQQTSPQTSQQTSPPTPQQAAQKPKKAIVHRVAPPPRGIKVPTVGDQDGPTDLSATLNYFAKPWQAVFEDLATATESELILDRVPVGYFTRRDKTQYTRAEAVRILNKEIEPLGFRLIEKGKFLIVMDLPSQRPRYAPAEIRPSSAGIVSGAEAGVDPRQNPAGGLTHPQHDVSQSSDPSTTELRPGPSPYKQKFALLDAPDHQQPAERQPLADRRAEAKPRTRVNDRSVTQVGYEEDVAPPARVAQPVNAGAQPARSGSQSHGSAGPTRAYSPQNLSVTEVARRVYKAFQTQSELVDAGRHGLPAFSVNGKKVANSRNPLRPPERVYDAADIGFELGLDEAADRLLVDGPPAVTAGVIRLVKYVDSEATQTPARIVTTTVHHARLAGQLAGELPRLAQAGRRGGLAKDENQDGMPGDEPAETGVPGPTESERGLSQAIGNLKGEVNLEAIEDLGVLILRGNEKDVDQVMQVIRQLEKLSEQTAPQLHVLYLKHVDSSAMSQLLTTVYERVAKYPGRATVPRQNVSIIPIDTPNAVLIIAPEGDLKSIRELAEELDQPTAPLTEFQIFPLKTAIAAQVVTLLQEFYKDRVGLGAKVLAIADARSNTIVVRARPRDLDEVQSLIEKIDREQAGSVNTLKIYPLKNAAANELALVINQAIQSVISPPQVGAGANPFGGQGAGGAAGGQVAEQFRDVRPAILEFLARGSDGDRTVRSGMLADIRINPDVRMNSLIVSAPEASVDLIAELIQQLDQPSAAVAEIKVFTLENAEASGMVEQLQQLFSPANATGGGGGNQARQQLGLTVAGAEDISSALVPLRFSVDTRTNSVIAVGGAEALRVVEAIMLRLDESDLRQRKNAVIRLKNSPAATVAQAVNQFLTSRVQLAQQNPQLISSLEQIEQEAVVTPETVTNSLLISSTPRFFEEIKQLVAKLDEAPRQVVIQALIVEVELDNNDEFGVELGFQDSILFDRSVVNNLTTLSTTNTAPNGVQTTTQRIISQSGSPGYLFNNPNLPLGNNTSRDVTNPGNVGSQGLSSFSLGRTNGNLGFGGLVLSAGSDSVNVLIRALAARRRLQVLSRPQIRTLDNQIAQIQVGQQVPVVDGVQVNQLGNANPQIRQDQAGIILTVTPRISPDGLIVMELIAEKSAFRGKGVPIFTDANNGNVIQSPIKDISAARTAVSVPNAQTVVMGGMITTSDETIERKVPWLGDIPLLGLAFRYDAKNVTRTELLIFLTPRIIHADADSEAVKDVEMSRMHFIEHEAEEVHGPLRGVPQGIPGEGLMLPEVPYCPPGSGPDGLLLVDPNGPTMLPPPSLPSGEWMPAPARIPALAPDSGPAGSPVPSNTTPGGDRPLPGRDPIPVDDVPPPPMTKSKSQNAGEETGSVRLGGRTDQRIDGKPTRDEVTKSPVTAQPVGRRTVTFSKRKVVP